MVKSALLASTAIGLLLYGAPASAQTQQKGSEEKTSPSQPQGMQGQPGKSAEPTGKGAGKGEGVSKGETKERPGKGTAQKEPQSEPKPSKGAAEQGGKDKASKGTAERPEPKGKAKGSAEKAPEPGKGTKGTAEKAPEPKGKGTKGAETAPGSEGTGTKGAGAEPKEKSGAGRVQLTEQKRTDVSQTLAKERNVNRATNVNVSVSIGTRLPRSVRLAAVPASIAAIVPQYRSYRYVVVEDEVCIVEPRTLEIVEVIPLAGQRTARGAAPERLVLTAEERAIILREVELDGGSTLGLGAIAEGADVPRDVELRTFPDVVVRQVPKVRAYRYFATENRVAIVDPQDTKVQLVIEQRR
jgi:hypothetical protein